MEIKIKKFLLLEPTDGYGYIQFVRRIGKAGGRLKKDGEVKRG